MNSNIVEQEIDLMQHWMVVKRRKWSIITLALLTTLLTMLVVYSITPIYKATSTLLIEAQQAKLPSIEDLYGLGGKDRKYYLTQLELMKSRKLAEQVIHKHHLDENSEFLPKQAGFSPTAFIKEWLGMSDGYAVNHTFEIVMNNFQSRLTTALVPGTQLITLTFESESPQLAAGIANAMANSYIEDQLSSRLDMTRQATEWMEQRLKVLKVNLETSERVMQDYLEKHGLVDVQGVSSLTAQELDELTSQLIIVRAKYSELGKRYGAKHPLLIAAKSEVRAVEAQLARSKGEITSIGRKEVKLRELQRQVDSNRTLYDTFLARLKEANQAVDLETSNARISDPAVAPLAPFKPKKQLIVVLAFFGSLMLGVLLTLLIEALDKTFKGSADLEAKLGLPILGMLPLIKSNRKNRKAQVLAMLDDKESAYAEAMRTIRTGLVLSSLDNPHKVILVTSSVPSEGKTSVSTNLAIAMGSMEKVLLIGADLRRPSLSKALEIPNSQLGLTNIVAGTSKFNECVHRLEKGGIDILPCGQLPPNPLELLSSKRFAALLEELEKHYDRIVIDSPPLQAVSDSLVLSKYAKAVVYVVEADSTHEKIVKNGIKRLLEHNAPIAGIVLNKFDVKQSNKYGYEYGGYYDQYGYSNGSDT